MSLGQEASASVFKYGERVPLEIVEILQPEGAVVASVVFLQNPDGQIMLAEKARGFAEGLLNGPGGKLEKYDDKTGKGDKSIDDTNRREALEELGIILGQSALIGVVDQVKNPLDRQDIMRVVFSVCKDYEFGAPPDNPEMINPKWYDIDGMPEASMFCDEVAWLGPVLADDGFFTGVNLHWGHYDNGVYKNHFLEEADPAIMYKERVRPFSLGQHPS